MSKYKSNKKPSPLRQYKKDLSRIGIYLLILIPIAVVESFFVSMLNFPIWLNCIIVIPTLLVWVVIFELIYVAIQKRKEKKREKGPYKEDIYAD